MFGRGPEICIEDRFARRSYEWMASGLKSHKNRVNLLKNFRVVEFHYPPMLRLVVIVKDSKTSWRLTVQLVAVITPGGIHKLAVRSLRRGKVESVKDERLALRIESAAKGLPRMALPIDIDYVYDMQIARSHDVAYLPAC